MSDLIFRIRPPSRPDAIHRPHDIIVSERHAAAFLKMLHMPALASYTMIRDQLRIIHSEIADLIQYGGELDTVANNRHSAAQGTAQHYLRLLGDLSTMVTFAYERHEIVEWTTR